MEGRFPVSKIISGGQTGADRGALDAARAAGCPYGGALPKGRKTEDGPLPPCYEMMVLNSANYSRRTEQNVIDSDGTLILSHGELTGGSLLTKKLAEKHERPWLHLDFLVQDDDQALQLLTDWIAAESIVVLNVAGPRASGDPRIYQAVYSLLSRFLQPHQRG